MKKQESKIGRPKKELPGGDIPYWTRRDVEKVRVILERSRAKHPGLFDPKPIFGGEKMRLSDETLMLVLEFFALPLVIDATEKPKTKAEDKITQIRTTKAIQFSKLFADAPTAMIDAFGKIQKLVEALARNPRNTVHRHIATKRILHLVHGSPDFNDERPENEIAGELKRFNKGITTKTIEHARKDIRTSPREA
jgi:hypothetical protein